LQFGFFCDGTLPRQVQIRDISRRMEALSGV
jgi:hypothetical protein